MRFWKTHNRRILKLLLAEGVPEDWLARDWYLDVVGLPDVEIARAALEHAFAEAKLGDVRVIEDVVRCAFSRTTLLYSQLLARETLIGLAVPRNVFIRTGFPVPTTAKWVYKSDKGSNLLKIAKGSRKRPVPGDVFAYSFDNRTFHWGLVIADDVVIGEHVPMVCFLNQRSDVLKAPPQLDTRNLLVTPCVIDDSCWRRGLFLTVENRALDPDDVRDMIKNGGERAPGNVPVSDGFMPWSSVDCELSEAHGIPMLA